MKKYIIMHKSDWSENDINDLIDVDIKSYHYSPATYWEPADEDLDFEPNVDDNFWKVVKIIEFDYFDNNEEDPFAVIADGITYCFNQKPGWEDLLSSIGWDFFCNIPLSEQDYSTPKAAQDAIDCWIVDTAEKMAYERIEEGDC